MEIYDKLAALNEPAEYVAQFFLSYVMLFENRHRAPANTGKQEKTGGDFHL